MKTDVFGSELQIGDFVAMQTYGSLSAGKIWGFTEKRAKVVVMPTNSMNHGIYTGYAQLDRVVKLDDTIKANLIEQHGQMIKTVEEAAGI